MMYIERAKKGHKEELKRKINTMSQIALQMVALSVSKGNKRQRERTCGMKHCCPSSTSATGIDSVFTGRGYNQRLQ